jgi:hypothetical protein
MSELVGTQDEEGTPRLVASVFMTVAPRSFAIGSGAQLAILADVAFVITAGFTMTRQRIFDHWSIAMLGTVDDFVLPLQLPRRQ